MSIKKQMKISILLSVLIVCMFSINVYAETIIVDQIRLDQDVTADVKPVGAKGASGLVMKVGYCAVHPIVKGDHENPMYPFGTQVVFYEPINHPVQGEMSTFYIQDIGDVNLNLWTEAWVEVFFGNGADGSWIDLEAEKFGIEKHDIIFKDVPIEWP